MPIYWIGNYLKIVLCKNYVKIIAEVVKLWMLFEKSTRKGIVLHKNLNVKHNILYENIY
jgi:hypothetical protein